MNEVLLTILVVACLSSAGLMFIQNRIAYIKLPFLIVAVYLFWLVPQAYQQLDARTAPDGGFQVLLLFALFCLGLIGVGWRAAVSTPSRSVKVPLIQTLDLVGPLRVFGIAAVFVGAASAVQAIIQMQPAEALAMRNPSGLITILRFLTTINSVALFLALTAFLYHRSPISAALVCIAIVNYVPGTLIQVKRADFAEFGLTILCCLWMVRRIVVPRLLALILGGAMFLVLWGVSELRGMSGYEIDSEGNVERQVLQLSDIAEVEWSDTLADRVDQGSEVVNGSFLIDHINRTGTFRGGANLWNNVVFQWVPGQIVGHKLKRDLLLPNYDLQAVLSSQGLEWQTGTTSTGFPEVYADFGLAGGLAFLFMAWIAGRAFQKAADGILEHAAVYPGMLVLAMTSMTHGGYTFFMSLPILVVARISIATMAGVAARADTRTPSSRTGMSMHSGAAASPAVELHQ